MSIESTAGENLVGDLVAVEQKTWVEPHFLEILVVDYILSAPGGESGENLNYHSYIPP